MNRLFEALSEIELELLTAPAAAEEPPKSESPSPIPSPDAEVIPIAMEEAPLEAPASHPASDLVLPIFVTEEKTLEEKTQDCADSVATENSASDHSAPEPGITVEADPVASNPAPEEESLPAPAPAVPNPEDTPAGIIFQTLPAALQAFDVAPPDPERQPEIDEAEMNVLPRDVFPTDVVSLILELRPRSEESASETTPTEFVAHPVAQMEETAEPTAPVVALQEESITKKDERVAIKQEPVAKESQLKIVAPSAPSRVILKVPPESRLVALTDPDSLGAEKFRALAARLENQHGPDVVKCFQVTSSVINEGKTLVSGNIGVTLAKHFGAKTLLVEGDLHRPTLASIFGLERLRGISHWWDSRDEDLTSFVHKLEGLPLWFLPAGRPSDRPSDVLRSSRFVYAFEKLASEFEWVVVDSTPMVPIVDVNLWSRLVDGTLLVAREGVTPVKALQKGLQALDHPNLIGMVLNDATATMDSKYDGQYYGSPKVKAERMNQNKRRMFSV